MKDIKYIILDFDGTIADTLGMAIKIFNRIAPEYDCKPINGEDWELIRTKRPQDLLKVYGVTNFKLVLILLRIRKEMSRLIPEIVPVKNITDALRVIKKSGLRLGILTSNSRFNVSAFLEDNGLSEVIDFIYSGKSLFGKDRVLLRLFDHENISPENVIYIGDETRDIEASKKAGIPVIAVAWGLNKKDFLASLHPDQIADTPEELFGCIQQICSRN
ncbi:MAG: HAD hydrolase-like protein [Bacteroidales bacterium]|nr:HAD hydrolase-like protein [Bacteroidales bacterium]